MNRPESVLIGYFPKKIALRTDWFKNPVVEDIYSVCECISKGPDDWIDQWKHNTAWCLFDTPETGFEILGTNHAGFTMLAYKLFPVQFDGGVLQPLEVASTARDDLADFEFLGYDIVSRSVEIAELSFEHSPLSCNNGCEKIPVNKHCLIDDLETAWTTARTISAESNASGSWEPGPYCLVEVYRRSR
ncbi:MAG: hypothetical protein WCV67_08360 [Victivallaceae bacterium]|jgi:hypothetical protein